MVQKNNILYKTILSLLVIYLLIFISLTTILNSHLIIFLLPLFLLVLVTGFAYIHPKDFSSSYVSKGNKIFYCFAIIVMISLKFFPLSSLENPQINIFSFFPEDSLSDYNTYINYSLIIGFLILVIPDIRYKSINWDYWQSNPYYKSLFSKIFFLIVLPIPLFGSFIYLIYKYELNESANIFLQTGCIISICGMTAYLFISLKNIAHKIIYHIFNKSIPCIRKKFYRGRNKFKSTGNGVHFTLERQGFMESRIGASDDDKK